MNVCGFKDKSVFPSRDAPVGSLQSPSTRASSASVRTSRTVGSILCEAPMVGYCSRPQSANQLHPRPPLASRFHRSSLLLPLEHRQTSAMTGNRREMKRNDHCMRYHPTQLSPVPLTPPDFPHKRYSTQVNPSISSSVLHGAPGHGGMPVNVRLFSYLIAEESPLTQTIRSMDERVFLSSIRILGARLGLRVVRPKEFLFLLSSALRDCAFSIHAEDVQNLFMFLDWHAKGTVDFKELLDNLGTLFRSKQIILALCCKRLMNTKQLDNAMVSITEVDAMLEALQQLFVDYIPQPSLHILCQEVHRLLMELHVDYSVPTTAVRATFNRFPTVCDMLKRLQWNGVITFPQKHRSELSKLLHKDDTSTTTPVSKRVRHLREELRMQDNRAILCEVNKLYNRTNHVEIEGAAAAEEHAVSMDVHHPHFVADKYLDRSRSAEVPAQ